MTAKRLKLSEIAESVGESERQIQRLVELGFVPKPERRGQYDFCATVRGIIRYYQEKAAKVSEGRTDSAARREKAEADLAEIRLADLKGEIRDALLQRVRQYGTLVRVTIGNLGYLPEELKRRICNDLAKAKLEEDKYDKAIKEKRVLKN